MSEQQELTISELAERNRVAGDNWFDPDNLRDGRIRFESRPEPAPGGGALFVVSLFQGPKRIFVVHHQLSTGQVYPLGEDQPTRKAAMEEMFRLLETLNM